MKIDRGDLYLFARLLRLQIKRKEYEEILHEESNSDLVMEAKTDIKQLNESLARVRASLYDES